MAAGTLTVQVIEGRELQNKHGVGHTHPAVKVTVGGNHKSTERSEGGSPVWNCSFEFNIIPEWDVLDVTIEDVGVITHHKMAEGPLALETCFREGSQDVWVNVRHKEGEYAGAIHLFLQFKARPAPPEIPAPSASNEMAVREAEELRNLSDLMAKHDQLELALGAWRKRIDFLENQDKHIETLSQVLSKLQEDKNHWGGMVFLRNGIKIDNWTLHDEGGVMVFRDRTLDEGDNRFGFYPGRGQKEIC